VRVRARRPGAGGPAGEIRVAMDAQQIA